MILYWSFFVYTCRQKGMREINFNVRCCIVAAGIGSYSSAVPSSQNRGSSLFQADGRRVVLRRPTFAALRGISFTRSKHGLKRKKHYSSLSLPRVSGNTLFASLEDGYGILTVCVGYGADKASGLVGRVGWDKLEMWKFREGLADQRLIQAIGAQTFRAAHFTHVDVSIEGDPKRKWNVSLNAFRFMRWKAIAQHTWEGRRYRQTPPAMKRRGPWNGCRHCCHCPQCCLTGYLHWNDRGSSAWPATHPSEHVVVPDILGTGCSCWKPIPPTSDCFDCTVSTTLTDARTSLVMDVLIRNRQSKTVPGASNEEIIRWKKRLKDSSFGTEEFSYRRWGKRTRMLWVVVNGRANSLPATPFSSVDNAWSVCFEPLLHGRVPMILDGVVRSKEGEIKRKKEIRQKLTGVV